MARRKQNGNGESLSGYFRKVLEERPEWLVEKSNDAILARYREDHQLAPDAVLPKNVRQGLANLKSVLRHKGRHKAKKRGRPPGGRPEVVHAAPVARRSNNGRLEKLEEAIDDCLTLAKHEDREEFHDVIQYLRRARNEVVWKLGQSDK